MRSGAVPPDARQYDDFGAPRMELLSRWLGRKPDSSPNPLRPSATAIPATWATSPPYLALLQRFLSLRDARTGVPEHWEAMFGTHPRNVVEGFLALHLLEAASLVETIEFCHTGAALKRLLKERGLKVSGRKAEQAQRLLDADPEGMQRFSVEQQIVRCTAAASQAVQTWLHQEALAREAATDETIAALRRRQWKTAVQIADAWRKRRFEPPAHPAQEALTIRPAPRTVEERAAEVAKNFTLRPKILTGLEPDQWEGLHVNYAIWQLLGQSVTEKCMPGFNGLRAMDATTVLRMMGFYVRHQEDLEQWKKLGIKKASIMCTNSGSCETCIALDKKTFRLDKLPELPYEGCTCALGCRCLYLADLGF